MNHLLENSFIPICNSPSGWSLTMENWKELGLELGCYYLTPLLGKPGLIFLQNEKNIQSFFNISSQWILNCSDLEKKNQNYVFCSPFDGNRNLLSEMDLISLINHLQPTIVILPKLFSAVETIFAANIQPIFFGQNTAVLEKQHDNNITHVYFEANEESLISVAQQCDKIKDKMLYLQLNVGAAHLAQIKKFKLVWVESERPARDALKGRVYTQAGDIHLLEPMYAMDFTILDENCACPPCQSGLSKAYLHHLLQQVPYLCQRFLIQHNISFYTTLLNS